MEARPIESISELQLTLRPAPDGPAVSAPEFQRELREFHRALKQGGIEASAVHYAFDSVEAHGGLTGVFALAVVTLGPTAIVQARKLIETILNLLAGGTTFELRRGNTVIKGSARDVQKILTPERFAQLLEGHRNNEGESSSEDPPRRR